jgi:ATP-dependent Clp protease ATP-binding subunit ClpC
LTRIQAPVRLRKELDGTHRMQLLLSPQHEAEGASIHEASTRLRALVRPFVERGELDVLRIAPGVPITERVVSVRVGTDVVTLTAAAFTLQALDFLVLPGLGGAILAFPAGDDASARAEQLELGVRGLVRAARRRGEELLPEVRTPGEHITELELRLEPKDPKLVLEPDALDDLFRAAFGAEPDFRGGAEISKIASDLTNLHPDRLSRARVPDDRVQVVAHALFHAPFTPLAIVGPAGCGRTTLVHEALAHMLEEGGASWELDPTPHPKVWHLDPGRIVSGMSVVGQWNRRLEAVLQYATTRNSKPDAFFCDRPLALTVIGRYAGSDLSVATVLRGWLQDRRLPFVIECTPEEWTRLEERDRPFAGLFSVLRVEEPAPDRALSMFVAGALALAERKATRIEPTALRRLLELDRRHPGPRAWPGRLLDRLERIVARGATTVDEALVSTAFQADTGLRTEIFSAGSRFAEPEARAFLNERLVGQGAAVEALVEVVLTLKTGLTRPDKPVATLFFAGPTGVGKTEAAKALAECLFSRDGLVRLDMNELGDSSAVERLLGTVHTAGLLTERLRDRPYAVLLLDEIEKAHPSVHDLLLGILDEGRVTDGAGRRLDLRGVVIVLTSNVGASEIGAGRGFVRTPGSLEGTFRTAVERHFRPEFVNRLDRIIAFSALTPAEIRRIADLIVRKVLSREGFARRTVLLDVPTELLDQLAHEGTDPTLGARALKRVIEQRLIGPVAEVLATVAPDLPVYVQAHLRDGVVGFDVRALPWAEEHTLERLADNAAVAALEAEVRAELVREGPAHDVLRAVAGPDGVTIIPLEGANLLEWLDDATRPDEPDHGGAPMRAVRSTREHLEGRGRFLRQFQHSMLSLREALSEVWTESKPRTTSALDEPLALTTQVARRSIVPMREPRPFRLFGEPLTRGSNTRAFARWVSALNETFARLPLHATFEGPLGWHLTGMAAASMWRHEAGIQLFLPVAGPADALRVRLVYDDGEVLDTPDEVIRTWVAPGPDHPGGIIHDLRSGELSSRYELRWLLVD